MSVRCAWSFKDSAWEMTLNVKINHVSCTSVRALSVALSWHALTNMRAHEDDVPAEICPPSHGSLLGQSRLCEVFRDCPKLPEAVCSMSSRLKFDPQLSEVVSSPLETYLKFDTGLFEVLREAV